TTEPGRIVCLDATKVKDGQPALVWKVDGITVKFVSPIIHEDRLYMCDESGRMFCMDAKTGATVWKIKFGRASVGSPVLADGKISPAEAAPCSHFLNPGPKKGKNPHPQFSRSPDATTGVELNASPAVADGRVYFTTTEETYCIGKPGLKAVKNVNPPQTRRQ